jgi:hypothetical protein
MNPHETSDAYYRETQSKLTSLSNNQSNSQSTLVSQSTEFNSVHSQEQNQPEPRRNDRIHEMVRLIKEEGVLEYLKRYDQYSLELVEQLLKREKPE